MMVSSASGCPTTLRPWSLLLGVLLLLLGTSTATFSSQRQILTFRHDEKLRVERNFAPKHIAMKLYEDLITSSSSDDGAFFEASRSNSNNNESSSTTTTRHARRLFDLKGDAGAPIVTETPSSSSPTKALRDVVTTTTTADFERGMDGRRSVVFRIEHLTGASYSRTKELINDVVPNRILDDDGGGTIHLYASSPGAAALSNHTDVTDIFVLQLFGAKEWFLCQESGLERFDTNNDDKFDSCATYDPSEIDELLCDRVTLHPGDALHLPRRVVHSARAPVDQPSVHLTFAFSENQCSKYDEKKKKRHYYARRSRRNLQFTCNAAEGGLSCDGTCGADCDESCDEDCNDSCDWNCNEECSDSCDSDCDTGCNSSCDSCCYGVVCSCGCDYLCDSSCDGDCDESCNAGCNESCDAGCNAGCDLSCDGSCNTSCDICPTPAPSPGPTVSPTPAPSPQPNVPAVDGPTTADFSAIVGSGEGQPAAAPSSSFHVSCYALQCGGMLQAAVLMAVVAVFT